MAELSKKVFSWGWIDEIFVEFSDRGRHAVLFEGVVVTHPRRRENEQEGILILPSLPSLLGLVLLPKELESSCEDVAHDGCSRILLDDASPDKASNRYLSTVTTSWNEIIYFLVFPEDLLDRHSSSDEETEDEAEEPC